MTDVLYLDDRVQHSCVQLKKVKEKFFKKKVCIG